MRIPTKVIPFIVAAGLAVSACSSSGSTTNTASSNTTMVTTSTTAAGASTTAGDASTGSTRVSANDASKSEIAAALSAAGVANADRWADEVVEYRPYDTSDPTMAELRQELAKYNPSAGTIDQIISALNP